jgi:cytochrome c2
MSLARSLRRAGAACGLIAGLLAGCAPRGADADAAVANGRLLLEQYGCGTCHAIPGVRQANGQLGPTLDSFARRAYIAGELPNQPEMLVRWIRQPSLLVPDTLMPDLAVRDAHARDMVVYLMSLR